MRRRKLLAAISVFLVFGATGLCQVATDTSKSNSLKNTEISNETFPLHDVATVVQLALFDAQQRLGDKNLPKLKTADLSFKTVVQKSGGFSVNFFIFKLGATHEKDVTNETSFQWSIPASPKPFSVESFGGPKAVELGKQLSDTIVAAGSALKNQQNIGELKPTGLTVSIAFGVQNSVIGGVTLPTLVAITPGFDAKYINNSVQTVKLTFENK